MNEIQLIVIDDMLFCNIDGFNELLIYCYPSGDIDTLSWPLESAYRTSTELDEQLAAAMYELRETTRMGTSVNIAVLPDGRKIQF